MAAFGEIRDEGLEQTREAIARFLKGRSGAGTLFSDNEIQVEVKPEVV